MYCTAMLSDSVFSQLALWQLLALAVGFVWSGFVRSGLGFGGAALTLPLLLMVHNDVLLYLPAICWQLLIFSSLTLATRLDNINWRFLVKLSSLLALPFAAGLFGLLNLSLQVLSLFVYAVTLVYGVLYALDRVLVSKNRFIDSLCIIGGGYVSGVSLMGAPLIMAYSAARLPASQLRDTLFVMWIVLVIGKLATFSAAGVNLQWQLSALTLPLVGLGHYLGLKAHVNLISANRRQFSLIIGIGLCSVSLFGLWAAL